MVQYSDGIKITVTGIDYCTEREVNENTAPVLRNWAGLII